MALAVAFIGITTFITASLAVASYSASFSSCCPFELAFVASSNCQQESGLLLALTLRPFADSVNSFAAYMPFVAEDLAN